MISILVIKQGEEYRGISIEGHAGYGADGEDIVCSAISVLSINLVNSLETFTDDAMEAEQEDGLIQISLGSPLSQSGKLLLDSWMLGVTSVRQEYGSTYIQLEIKEV